MNAAMPRRKKAPAAIKMDTGHDKRKQQNDCKTPKEHKDRLQGAGGPAASVSQHLHTYPRLHVGQTRTTTLKRMECLPDLQYLSMFLHTQRLPSPVQWKRHVANVWGKFASLPVLTHQLPSPLLGVGGSSGAAIDKLPAFRVKCWKSIRSFYSPQSA